jgi:hypothetical protein
VYIRVTEVLTQNTVEESTVRSKRNTLSQTLIVPALYHTQ